ncbi:hypothetical protein [Sphingomonas gei]|uniref:hypothetical protein n=1 Tax=Sphingomonas gei TaxID=1395960 RepID=UPI0019CFCDC3|nr:hypothetical protein [Sphingomonas gei]
MKTRSGQFAKLLTGVLKRLFELVVHPRPKVFQARPGATAVVRTEDGGAFHARARDVLADVDDLQSMFAGDRVA